MTKITTETDRSADHEAGDYTVQPPATLRGLISLVESDLYRYTGRLGKLLFLNTLIRQVGFRYSFLMRMTSYFRQNSLCKYSVYGISNFVLRHDRIKYGIDIPVSTRVGGGLYIGHFGGIVVSERAVIGMNCNISNDVTIGQSNRGKRKGYPTIGDNVFIGPGARIIGNVRIGNNVAVGANCVVTRDIPDNAVVVGVPGRVISYEGSKGYINRTEYDSSLKSN